MASKQELTESYQQVTDRVAEAAARSGRRPEDVIVVAVTKYATPDQIRQLLELGHVDLGESRVQQFTQRVAMAEEFIARHHEIPSPRPSKVPQQIRWHMVGHLQRNKVKPLLPLVKLIHSVDSLRLAEELQAQANRQDREIEVLIQINAAGENAKGGVAPAAAAHLADQMDTMFNLRLRGLMTMAPRFDNPKDARPTFTRTSELFNEMLESGNYGQDFRVLSMGMSDDYEVAIECGANVVRIGRALFGDNADADNT